jgi:sugar lactone lactonase YvrE
MPAHFSLVRAFVAQACVAAVAALAHPGSGIVVDALGNIYFNHTGRGVAKISPQGGLTYVGKTGGGHWLCLDADGSFSRAQPRYFERITPAGAAPALIYADGGSPIAVPADGRLYYASGDETMTPGGLQVTRQSPEGTFEIFPRDGKPVTEKLGGITGLAPGPDGAVYIATPSAILKLTMDGAFTILASAIKVKDCDVDYPDHDPTNPLPSLRGLAVDADGTVFVAAVGCHAVVRIRPGGSVESVLKAERPWSPTGVAVGHGDLYILEYTNANGSRREGWRPRVRRLTRAGQVTTLWVAP